MLLKKLEKEISNKGLARVSADLGYRSVSTIRHWFTNNEIPLLAKQKVEKYLKEKKNESKQR